MVGRNINYNRDVTEVVAEKMDTGLVDMAVDMARDVADASAQSKVLEATSQAQIAFKQLDQDYRVKYEGDPNNPDGLRELSEARQNTIEELGKGIPTFHTRKWAADVGALTDASKKTNGLWAVEQNYKNLVTNVENSRKNYLELASVQGQQYGSSPSDDASVLLNYTTAYNSIKSFADENLSDSHAQKLLQDFGPDYLKMTLSGVAMTNPVKARQLMDDPMVVKTLGGDAEQFLRFKSAIESRAKHYEKAQQQKTVVDGVREDITPLLTSGGDMTYAQFAGSPMSEKAKEYYAQLNGFTHGSGKRGGFTAEDKAEYSLAILESVQALAKDPEMDPQSVRVVQDKVFDAMNRGAISKTEGLGYVKQIIEPLLAKKEEAMKQYGHDTWFTDATGFEGIQDYYDKNIAKPIEGMNADTRAEVQVKNRIDKSRLYDYYARALATQAEKMGTTVMGLQSEQYTSAQRKAAYGTAQTEAIKLFTMDKHPELRTSPDLPNWVYTKNGEMVQGLAGPRNVKPVGSAPAPFKLHPHKKTGKMYRVYPDGRIEPAP